MSNTTAYFMIVFALAECMIGHNKLEKLPNDQNTKKYQKYLCVVNEGPWYENHEWKKVHRLFSCFETSPAHYQKLISEILRFVAQLQRKLEFEIFGHSERDNYFT